MRGSQPSSADRGYVSPEARTISVVTAQRSSLRRFSMKGLQQTTERCAELHEAPAFARRRDDAVGQPFAHDAAFSFEKLVLLEEGLDLLDQDRAGGPSEGQQGRLKNALHARPLLVASREFSKMAT
jgi:hypothetical protein